MNMDIKMNPIDLFRIAEKQSVTSSESFISKFNFALYNTCCIFTQNYNSTFGAKDKKLFYSFATTAESVPELFL